jgi:rSAM/selenodomain-associated transferase 1
MTGGEDTGVVLAIMAKAPRAGEVKTRLCPPLSPAEAATLYRCFLLDKVAQVRGVGGVSTAIAFTPDTDRNVFEELAPGVQLVAQRGDDLGGRLLNGLDELLRDGYAAALAIDSDTPTLPTEFLRQAVELVVKPEIDLVLGPSDDGGYYLIGMRRVWPFLFDGMPWSTAGVLSETIRRAEAHELRVACLPSWFDVDTPEDLDRLIASFAEASAQAPSHTRRFLERRTQ